MSIKRYKKKPVEIEAVQYTNLNADEISDFVGVNLKQELESETAYEAGKGPPKFSLIIPTLEGEHKAMPMDFIIKGVKGEFYPCKPDIFDLTYVLVGMRYISFKRNQGQNHQLDEFKTKEEAIASAKALHDPDWPDGQSINVWSFRPESYFGHEEVFTTEKEL